MRGGVSRSWEGHGFPRLRKNSACDPVLKGRGLEPRRKCLKINSGFRGCGKPQTSQRKGKGTSLRAVLLLLQIHMLDIFDSMPQEPLA